VLEPLETSQKNPLKPYLTYSSALHFFVVSWILIANFSKQAEKNYFSVDFIGSGSSSLKTQAPIKREEAKTQADLSKRIDPKEDLLIKPKEEEKKEKEIVNEIPSLPPPPIPQAKSLKQEKLSDAGIIPTAPSGSGVGLGFGPDNSALGSGEGGNFPYSWYVFAIKKSLDIHWNITSGFNRRIYSQVVFTITRDGSLTDVELEESSKNSIFDQAAVRAVKESDPFPPLPEDFQEPNLRVHVRFTVKR